METGDLPLQVIPAIGRDRVHGDRDGLLQVKAILFKSWVSARGHLFSSSCRLRELLLEVIVDCQHGPWHSHYTHNGKKMSFRNIISQIRFLEFNT